MTHSRRLHPAAVVEVGPAEAEATRDPASPGPVSRMSHGGLLVSRMSHSRRPDRGRGRVGWHPLHGGGAHCPAAAASPRTPAPALLLGGVPRSSLSAWADKTGGKAVRRLVCPHHGR